MNEWLERIHNCGFTASINIDDEPTITLHWIGRYGPETFKVSGMDLDGILVDTLRFAEMYDAYVNTAPQCFLL